MCGKAFNKHDQGARGEAMAKHSPATHEPVLYQHSLLTSEDLFLFNEGTHYRLTTSWGRIRR